MAEPAPILLDGALGTELTRRGFALEAPLFSVRALLEAPALLTAIHLDYVRAGAQIVTTNSFGLHASSLAAAGLGERQRELAARSVEVIEAARRQLLAARGEPSRADEAGLARFRVAGSIPPLPGSGEPSAGRDAALERAELRALANALVAAGVDLILLETFTSVAAAREALEALDGLAVPVWLAVVAGAAPDQSMSRRPDGARLLGGDDVASLLELTAAVPGRRRPDALLINCTQIDAVPAALDRLAGACEQAGWDGPLGLYPHLGKRRVDGVWIERIVGPEAFAEQIAAWRRPPLRVVGACCGSTPAYIAALRRWLQPDRSAREQAYVALAELLP